MVVLDEADRMLSETFAEDLGECLGMLPKAGKGGRQTLLFTATMTEEVRMLKEMEGRDGRRECFVCEVDTDRFGPRAGGGGGRMLTRGQSRDSANT